MLTIAQRRSVVFCGVVSTIPMTSLILTLCLAIPMTLRGHLKELFSTSDFDSVPRHDLCQWLPMKLQEEFTVLKAGRPMESGMHVPLVYAVGHQRLMF